MTDPGRPPRTQEPAAAAGGPHGAPGWLLSVVVPVRDERSVLSEFHARLMDVLQACAPRFEVLYVNDGSRDGSEEWIAQPCPDDGRVGLLDLSRNFGKEIGMAAGLDHARGDAVVLIDADLQDPPEQIPELVARWQDGYDNVRAPCISCSARSHRSGWQPTDSPRQALRNSWLPVSFPPTNLPFIASHRP